MVAAGDGAGGERAERRIGTSRDGSSSPMKSKRKISPREAWVLALLPSIAIIGIYLFGIVDGLTANFEKQQKRLVASTSATPVAPGSSTLAKAKAAREAVKHEIEDRQTQLAQLEAKTAALPRPGGDRHESASVIERVETIFRRNGITPVTSEPADDGAPAANAPTALLDVLSPKLTADQANARREARVWHCIFDDKTPRFQRALADLTRETPTVLPLSLNLVYNPANFGETRLLELWLLY
jgi:hypothetical protein